MGTRCVGLVLAAAAWAGEPAEPTGPDREEIHRVVEAIARLKQPDPAVRQRALRTLQRFREKAIRPLVLAARTDDATLRARIAEALGLVGQGDRDALFALGTLLQDPETPVRRAAVAALARAGGPLQIPDLQPLLEDRVEAVRADAVRAIAELDPPGAAKRLAALLGHEDPCVRRAALAELVARDAPGLDALLPPLLKDGDPGVRREATAALARVRGPKAVETLLGLLADKDPYVRATAVAALKDLGARQAVPRLMDLLEDPSEAVRLEAISALGRLDVERVSVRALLAQLTAASARVRERAALALGFLGRKRGEGDAYAARARRAVPALIQLLGDEAPDVRQKAHFALRLILEARVVFDPTGSVEERQRAIAEWQRIWQESKK